jgi:hypothetical protein
MGANTLAGEKEVEKTGSSRNVVPPEPSAQRTTPIATDDGHSNHAATFGALGLVAPKADRDGAGSSCQKLSHLGTPSPRP